MARFLIRSELARVTPVLGHHCRSSLGLFSTTPKMKIPTFGNPNKYLKRIEERNEKHRKVQQLAKYVKILSCESTAKGGICDVYVVGATHCSPESCKEAEAIMSYLKPSVLFLELCKSRSDVIRYKKPKMNSSVRDLCKSVMGKKINIYYALEVRNFEKYARELETSEFYVAYQEAIKYGSKVVLGDRPMQVSTKRLWGKMSLWEKTCTLLFQSFGKTFLSRIRWEVWIDERDKYMAHQLLKVARKNNSVVAIVGWKHVEGIKKHWTQPIVVEDLMTIPSPSNSYLQCLGVVVAGVATIVLVVYFCL